MTRDRLAKFLTTLLGFIRDRLDRTSREMFETGYRDRERSNIAVPVFIALTGLLLKMVVFRWHPCPPGADPGLRIKNAVNLATIGEPDIPYPAFDVTLSCIWMICGMTTYNVVMVSELFVAVMTVALAFPAYTISKEIFKKRGSPETCSFLFVFYPALHELISFGSYTQALALFLIAQTIALAVKAERDRGLEKKIAASIVCAALLMMHFWSFAILVATVFLFLCMTVILAKRESVSFRLNFTCATLLSGLLGAFLVSMPWWLPNISFLGRTLLFVPTGLTGMRGVGVRVERFFSPYWLYILTVPAAIVGIRWDKASKIKEQNIILLLSWMFTPILLTQSYLVGIAADYRRLWYYPALPTMVIASFGLSFVAGIIHRNLSTVLKPDLEDSRSGPPRRHSIGDLMILLILTAIIASPGWWTVHDFESAARYYIHIRNPEYRMIGWIGERIPEGREIVSGGTIGWWIPGLSKRHVIPAVPTAFIGVSWQAERAEDASFLIGSNEYEITNGELRIRDSNPHLSARNPSLEVWGERQFEEIISLDDHDIRLVEPNGKEVALSELTSRTCSWGTLNENEVTLRTEYTREGLTVVKSITLMRGGEIARIEFRLTSFKRRPPSHLRLILSAPKEHGYNRIIGTLTDGSLEQGDPRGEKSWIGLLDSRREIACILIAHSKTRINPLSVEEKILELDLKTPIQENSVVLYIGGYKNGRESTLSDKIEKKSTQELFSPSGSEEPDVQRKDYWWIARKYRIHYLVTIRGDITRNFRDPRMNLLFSTGRNKVFRLELPQRTGENSSG